MVSPVLAQAILGQKAPDIVGSFEAGQQQAQLERSQEAARTAATRQFGSELGEVAATDPAVAAELAKALDIPVGETKRLESFAKDLQIANSLADTDPQQAVSFMLQRRNKLNNLGIETPTIDEFLQTASFDPDKAVDDLDKITEAVEKAGIVKPAELGKSKAFAPVTLVNPKTKEKILASPTIGADGRASLNRFDIPEGFQVSRETAEEKRSADAVAAEETARGRTRGTQSEKRDQAFIDRGLAAADSTANVRRGIQLLEEVETGGIDAIALRAKQIFGVESGDEGELVGLLGKAVLSQLRETFGAQFTVKEGEQLARIEAGVGKSPAGNRRLLNNALTLLDRLARRGLKAAKDRDDTFSVEEIESALAFDLDAGAQPAPTSQPAVQAQPAGAQRARLIFNPATGKLEPK
jgi:hypothetical protein